MTVALTNFRLVTGILLWYARHVPYHRGKTRLSRYLRAAFGVHLNGEVVERRDGLWWSLDRGDYICQDLYWSSANDRAELREALRAMPAGGVMLDVGANYGYYAITIAVHLRQNCTVHAFEPNPPVFDRLRRNLQLNSSTAVIAHQVGLSDREGTAAMVETAGHSGATWLCPGDAVAVTMVDRFAEQTPLSSVHLIKIDAEGMELHILRGAAGVLQRFRPTLLIELNGPALERQGTSSLEVLSFLQAAEYQTYVVKPRRRITLDETRVCGEVLNLLCLPVP
jgi:FkbM family methyltransferase